MRAKIVAGNWKMHGSKAMINEFAEYLLANKKALPQTTEIIFFPPAIYLAHCELLFAETKLQYGAQNVYFEEDGAYTGELSAVMLAEFGCSYTLVGHSERRVYFHETNEMIAKKAAILWAHHIKPVICIGETLAQFDANQTFNVLNDQIKPLFRLENWRDLLQNATLAYEPVWAIGTGKTATPEQAQAAHGFIRGLIQAEDADLAAKLPILYGGSVKPNNAKGLFAMPDIDGALVGGASLKAQDFLEIIQCNS